MIVLVLQDGLMPFHEQMYGNGRMHSLVSGHIVLDIEADGVSYAGAQARVVADDGSEIALEMSLVDALIFTTHGLTINEAICIARTADGREGFALVESINNPRNGSDSLVRVVRSTLEDGLSYRETPKSHRRDQQRSGCANFHGSRLRDCRQPARGSVC